MSLSGKTKPFAVIGHPIGHSLSPVMHNASMTSIGYDGIYLALDVHPDRLMSTLPVMQDMGFGGVNLTVPHKEIAFQGLSQLDETARLYGAVNTVAFNDNEMIGYNTDGYGFLKKLLKNLLESVWKMTECLYWVVEVLAEPLPYWLQKKVHHQLFYQILIKVE